MQWALERETTMLIKAIKPLYFNGGKEVGDVFEAGQFASALIRMGKAVPADDAKAMQAEEADKPKRGKYQRKDMQATDAK